MSQINIQSNLPPSIEQQYLEYDSAHSESSVTYDSNTHTMYIKNKTSDGASNTVNIQLNNTNTDSISNFGQYVCKIFNCTSYGIDSPQAHKKKYNNPIKEDGLHIYTLKEMMNTYDSKGASYAAHSDNWLMSLLFWSIIIGALVGFVIEAIKNAFKK